MIPTLVITLREGVEASLIVGIVAAFLVKQGRRDALGLMWLGVGLAVAICVAVAVALRVIGDELPQREQEGLETIVGVIAVGMITYMIIWMRRHARGLKAQLEGHAAEALAVGSATALVGMAFLAVLREGFETSVFLLAAFQDTSDTTAAGAGAVIGLVAAVALGFAIYFGGVRINLSRFFRITGFVLVLVAAGLLATAAHTAHEAGWINGMQGQALDLTWLVQPGTVTGSLLTGMLGLQPQPTEVEVLVYLLYAIPMGLYVVWPDRWREGDPASPPARNRHDSDGGVMTTRPIYLAASLTIGPLLFAGCGELRRRSRRSDQALLQAHGRGLRSRPGQCALRPGHLRRHQRRRGRRHRARGARRRQHPRREREPQRRAERQLHTDPRRGHLHALLPRRRLRRARHPDRHGRVEPAQSDERDRGGRPTTAATSRPRPRCSSNAPRPSSRP